ncbi:hypothetical protein TrLO_g772 [Triparma laevis f. longispina]|uniref:Uncharacterized protein n=1 Tax=Triparma laevis f. longispina TaxID=1714387 RepID=A0A9W7C4L7_9STRA|nr:hypothetical protein TrLO_g772 [Triparma laevis f. longispina]
MRLSSALFVILASTMVGGFHISTTTINHRKFGRSQQTALRSENDDSARSENDDSAPPKVGDWRSFRSKMMAGGLPTTEEVGTGAATASTDSATASTSNKEYRLKHVASANMEQLKSQSPELHSELEARLKGEGNPVFVLGEPEVGGLVARMPLPYEIWVGGREFLNRKKRSKLLKGLSQTTANDDKHSDPLYYKAVGRVENMLFPSSDAEKKKSSTDAETQSIVASAVKTTAVWYKASETVVNDLLNEIAIKAIDKDGAVNDASLSSEERDFLNRYIKCNSEWEELGLVVSHGGVGAVKCSDKGESIVLNLNRPLASGISETLAKLILKGSYLVSSDEDKPMDTDNDYLENLYDRDFFDKFSKAFSKNGVCYVGGDDEQGLSPGIMLSGVQDLKGGVELANGIYVGGVEDAVERVLSGQNKATDFRFFIGRKTFVPGFLEAYCVGGTYQPFSAPRAFALKQCIGLPMPLYHELLGLAGGEVKDVSGIEIVKRKDLEDEAGNIN